MLRDTRSDWQGHTRTRSMFPVAWGALLPRASGSYCLVRTDDRSVCPRGVFLWLFMYLSVSHYVWYKVSCSFFLLLGLRAEVTSRNRTILGLFAAIFLYFVPLVHDGAHLCPPENGPDTILFLCCDLPVHNHIIRDRACCATAPTVLRRCGFFVGTSFSFCGTRTHNNTCLLKQRAASTVEAESSILDAGSLLVLFILITYTRRHPKEYTVL